MTIKRALTIIASLAILSPATAAGAPGTYKVTTCNAAPSGENNSWTWSTDDTAHYEDHTHCPYPLGDSGGTIDKESGLSSTGHLGATLGAQPESHAGWVFTAPPNTTISGITYERYLGHENDTSNTWSPALRADGTIIDNQTCTVIFPSVACALGGPPGQGEPPTTITGLTAKELVFGEACQASQEQECVTGNNLHSVWAALYGATVTLTDTTPPTITTPTGTLWEPGKTNGYHKGTETVTTSAQDIGGGIQHITLASDGTPVETYTTTCDYTRPRPCPLSTGQQTLTLPTTELSDGTHTLTLYATDAAQNKSSIATQQITIDNRPPPPPTELTATAIQPGSSTFIVRWTNPPGQIAPITSATYQVCSVMPETCGPTTPAPASGPVTITVPSPGTWTLKLWLTDAAENTNPRNAAQTILSVPPGNPGGSQKSTPNNQDRENNTNGKTTNTTGSNSIATSRPAIRLSETLRGRHLIVHVSGPSTGRVRVSYTGRLQDHTIAAETKVALLKHGKLTIIFKLGPHTAAHATIRVTAQLNHHPPITRVLRRRRRTDADVRSSAGGSRPRSPSCAASSRCAV